MRLKFTDVGDVSVVMERATGARWKIQVKDTGRGITRKNSTAS